MSQLRAPRIAGVAGGVGTTTLATALRGYDRGRSVDRGAEVLVCRSTGDSLHAAAAMITWLGAGGLPRPVLAVTADGAAPVRGPLRARLRMIEPQVSGLILLPYVAHWRELTDPLSEAARLSETPPEMLPKALRPYGEALLRLADAVLRSGLLMSGRGAAPHTPPPANRGIAATGQLDSLGHTGPLDTGLNRTTPTQPVPGLPSIPSDALPFSSPVVSGGVR
jgi:hypothetical protein